MQAQQALNSGRPGLFEIASKEVDTLDPGNPEIANMRGAVCAHAGNTVEAKRFFHIAIRRSPKEARFYANLARIHLDEGDHSNAEVYFGKALKHSPSSLPLQLTYCHCLLRSRKYEELIAILEPSLRKHPDIEELNIALYCAYNALDQQGEKGLPLLARVLARNPEHDEARFKLAQLCREEGRFNEAEEHLRKLLLKPKSRVEAYQMLTLIKRFSNPDDPDIAAMRALHAQSKQQGLHDRMGMSFALGKALDDLKQYDQAFEFFQEANDIRRKESNYDLKLAQAYLDKTIEVFTPELLSHPSDIEDGTPIFIVGMPRCGSTLTEQILAAHPDVVSRGECSLLEGPSLGKFHSADNPITLDRMGTFAPPEWGELGRTYLELVRRGDEATQHITDKSLQNIWLIGVIRCAMPHARIIHVKRRPLNSCLSMYKLEFQGEQIDFAYTLEELGNHYRMYQQVMQHWRDVLPDGAMYELNYEDLVTDQEGETRKLLEYCDLPWNAICLQFNKVENKVKTASIAQVRRPIYTDSLDPWRRYEKHLEPLIRILGTE